MSLHTFDGTISKLVRVIMRHGKKHAALRIVDDAFTILRRDHGIAEPVEFTKRALQNAAPLVELKKYKVSGRAIQVPSPCSPARQQSLGLRFVRDAFRARKELGSGLRLARELLELEAGSGRAFKRREEMHKQAEANRAFAHFLK